MAISPRQFGSVFELQFPQSVGIYSSYADAQKAVDFLADQKFEVQNLASRSSGCLADATGAR